MIHIVFMSRTSPSAALSDSRRCRARETPLGGRREREVVEAAAAEHGPRSGRQRRPIEDLERMEDGRGTHLEEDVPYTSSVMSSVVLASNTRS